MLGKPSRRTRKNLEEHGKRAPAVVVEIAERGMSISSGQLVSNTELVLKTKLRIARRGVNTARRLRDPGIRVGR